jgi:hypothetical protein
MTALRRRMRAVAFAWLLCQVASLSAFLPGECCTAHAAAAAAKAKDGSCHESAAPAVTPKDGDACPLHKGRTSHDCCTISNACDGPGQQLTTLFAYVAVVQAPQSASILIESTAAYIAAAPSLPYHRSIPDTPPPKLKLA